MADQKRGDEFLSTVITSRVRLARNLADLPFPKKLKSDERVYSVLMSGVQNAVCALGQFDFYMLSKLTGAQSLALYERHLISADLSKNLDIAAVLISKDESVSVMINEEDHIRLQCFEQGLALGEAYKKANLFDDEIGKRLKIAFDERLGYLTSCPTNLGTGMRASVLMFLPGLVMTNSITQILTSAQKAGITTRGLYGEGSDAKGHMFQLSNQTTLGLSEEEILQRVERAVAQISEAELTARDRLYKNMQSETKDKIFRAFAILKNAYMLGRQELMESVGAVKLGVYYKLLDVPYPLLNALVTETQHANLCRFIKKELNSMRESDIARATFVRERLKRYNIGE